MSRRNITADQPKTRRKTTGRSYAWNDTEDQEDFYCIGSDCKRVEFVKSSL